MSISAFFQYLSTAVVSWSITLSSSTRRVSSETEPLISPEPLVVSLTLLSSASKAVHILSIFSDILLHRKLGCEQVKDC